MTSNLSIIGGGYVGLVTAACFAELGHQVTCLEINPLRLRSLKNGKAPIFEPQLNELIASNYNSGRLTFTDKYEAIRSSDFAFVAVNTPPCENGCADTSFVFKAVDSILQKAQPGLVIVVKSTVPVGTGDQIAHLVKTSEKKDIEVVSNPEFLREGTAIMDFLQPDRIVIGAEDSQAGKVVAELYSGIQAPIVFCKRASAELSKYASNAFLATRISFINEIAAICNAARADIHEVEKILGLDRRIGPSFLKAGIGWGGSCFPKDLLALIATAKKLGHRASIAEAAFDTNSHQRHLAYEYIKNSLTRNGDSRVGFLGLAFKANTDDIRESPAIDIIQRLRRQGIEVRAHDPVANVNARQVVSDITYCDNPYDVASGSDVMVLATEWPNFLALDWAKIKALMRGRVILDGRNVLDPDQLKSLGFEYLSFGRSATKANRLDWNFNPGSGESDPVLALGQQR